MFNIRQVYLDHVGFPGAWFQDVNIPFFNSEMQPDSGTQDTILSLTNGGGKTTLLSLIFTCFVPDKRQFVQHLQKPHHHFKDYFTEKPGLILIELEQATDQLQTNGKLAAQTLVVGQYVTIDPSTGEDDRQFFAFEPTSDLNFEAVPSLGKKDVTNKDEVKQWLKVTCEQIDSFFRPQNNSQAEWMKWLDSKGIDTWIIKKQVDFCRTEGGIDAYMNFQKEEDFLKEFFHMVMPPDAAESNRTILSEALKKLQKRPEYERRRHLLEGLKNKLSPFAGEASHMVLKEEELKANQRKAALLYQGMKEKVLAQDLDIETRQNLIKNQELERKDLEEKQQGQEANIEAIEVEILQQKIDLKEVDVEAQKKTKEEKSLLEKEAKAALVLHQKQYVEMSIRSYEDSIQNASLGLAPVLEAKQRAAWTYKAKLNHLKEQKQNWKLEKAKEKSSLQQETGRLKENLEEQGLQKNQLSKEEGKILTIIQQRNDQRERLIQDQLLKEEETAQEKMGLLHAKIEAQEEGVLQKKAQQESLHEQSKLLDRMLQNSIRNSSDLKNDRKNSQEKQEKALNQKKRLQAEPLLFQMVGDDDFDPGTKELALKLRSYKSRKETEERDLAFHLQKNRGKIEFMEQTDSLLLDENTQAAIQYLQDNGMKDVFFFPEYFSGINLDHLHIQKLVESNPGRFLGIGVYEQDWEKAGGCGSRPAACA